jgi:hypothetical protein
MNSLENFAKAIEDGDSTLVESLLASGSIDVNARLPRLFNPPHSSSLCVAVAVGFELTLLICC